ncbi:hypothetical protein JHK85_001523 [Glycine max]|nr:hypothetical protein JHK85_001523 [Glycine max]
MDEDVWEVLGAGPKYCLIVTSAPAARTRPGGAFLGCFSHSLDISIAFHAELQVGFLAIEIAQGKGPDQLCLKGDSLSLAQVFKSHLLVPWKFQNRWINCLSYTK